MFDQSVQTGERVTTEESSNGTFERRFFLLSMLGLASGAVVVVPKARDFLEAESRVASFLCDGVIEVVVSRNQNYDGKLTQCEISFLRPGSYTLDFIVSENLNSRTSSFELVVSEKPITLSTRDEGRSSQSNEKLFEFMKGLRGLASGALTLRVEYVGEGALASKSEIYL